MGNGNSSCSYCKTVPSLGYDYIDCLQCLEYRGRGEIAVLNAVTSVLLHYSSMDTYNDCSVVSTG